MRSREYIEDLLRAVFDDVRANGLPDDEKRRDEFVFHMTDWLDDLTVLWELFHSQKVSADVAAQRIVGFLIHVTPHLNAAGRALLDGVPDPFSDHGQE